MKHEYFVPCTQCGGQLDPVTQMCPVCDVLTEDGLEFDEEFDEDLDPEEEED